jgi:hypothetical protein
MGSGWPIIGRSGELSKAVSVLLSVDAAPGRGVIFAGLEGVGKSRLLDELGGSVEAQFAVVPVYATAALAQVNFGAFHGHLPAPAHRKAGCQKSCP